jgi:hypothetical protein
VDALDLNLPGADLVREGLADLLAGRETEAALLVSTAGPRLRALGLDVPDEPAPTGERASTAPGRAASPEHRLYALLAAQPGGGAYSRYNALLARMASFARAAEHASTR